MRKFWSKGLLLPGLVAALLCLCPNIGVAKPLYSLTKSITLGGPDMWDTLTFDPLSHRVYIAHLDETTVVDAASGRIVGRVSGLVRTQGQAVVPEIGRGYADSSQTGTVTVFDLATFKPIKTLQTQPDADIMIYDAGSGRVFVTNGDSASLTIIDTATDSMKTISLGGSPEAGAVDGRGKLFINIESTREIVRVDTKTETIDARWPVPTCVAPHGMAIDIRTHRLFSSCFNQRLIVTDADTGKLIATFPIGKGTDGAVFDPKRRRVLSSNGDGTVTVIGERGPNRFVMLGSLKTLPGARTMTVDPETGRLFLVAGTVAHVARPKHEGGPPQFSYAPGSLKLLVFDPVP